MKPASSSPTRATLWRLHGLAAMLATPFLVVAAVTGLLYVPTPQIEAWQLAPLMHADDAGRPWLSLDRLVAAAREAAPERDLRHVLPPHAPGSVMRAVFEPPAAHGGAASSQHDHASHGGNGLGPLTLYVEPATARVLGQRHEMERFGPWAKRLHSQLLLGEGWRWMIEWAATCLLVMLATGAALAWPRRGQPFWPRGGLRRGQSRAVFKQWHAVLGLFALLMSLAITLTGLTWSRYAGAQIRELRDAVGQAPPRAPAALRSDPADANAPPMSWQAAWDTARRHAPDVALQLTAPRVAASADDGSRLQRGTWRAASADTRQPDKRFETHFDAYSGRVLFHAGWVEQSAFAKATAIGIPFHRGEFGLWNQVVLALFGITVLLSTVTGWVMWWRRPRTGVLGLAVHARDVSERGSWRWAALAGAAIAWIAPLLLIFAALWLTVEVWTRQQSLAYR
jgi:uncharacterized iron-regulated membrane protein